MHRRMRRRVVVVLCVTIVAYVLADRLLALRSGQHGKAIAVLAVPLSISCPVSGVCFAVDNQGNFVTGRDASWSKPESLERDALTSIACASANLCISLDNTGRARVFRGVSWSSSTPVARSVGILGDGTSSVSCAPDTAVCVVGDALGRVRTFDGSSWAPRKMIASANPDTSFGSSSYWITGVSCASSIFCAAVTGFGRAFVLNGSRWTPTVVRSDASPGLQAIFGHVGSFTGVSCPSSSFCVAVDQGGDATVYRSGRWGQPNPIDPTSVTTGNRSGLTAVSCATVKFCMAVDDLGRVLGYDGVSWSAPRLVDPNLGLSSISCPSVTFCAALDRIGMALEFNGTSWTTPRSIEG